MTTERYEFNWNFVNFILSLTIGMITMAGGLGIAFRLFTWITGL